MALKTLGARTFAALAFGALTLHGTVTVPSGSVASPSSGSGAGGRATRQIAVQSAPEEFHDAIRRGRIKQEDEELTVLVTAFLRTMT